MTELLQRAFDEAGVLIVERWILARADGSYAKLLDRLAKAQLLILDDFGLATLVTSQLPFDHWHAVVGDATFADAILDHLVHNAHRITLKGGSMRRSKNLASQPDAVA